MPIIFNSAWRAAARLAAAKRKAAALALMDFAMAALLDDAVFVWKYEYKVETSEAFVFLASTRGEGMAKRVMQSNLPRHCTGVVINRVF